ncbi:MAG: hypothetical protein AAGF10_05610 [Verrucomicrobiota bacterium]
MKDALPRLFLMMACMLGALQQTACSTTEKQQTIQNTRKEAQNLTPNDYTQDGNFIYE